MDKRFTFTAFLAITLVTFMPLGAVAAVKRSWKAELGERISHAKELLGEAYAKSAVRASEKEKKMSPFIQSLVKKLVTKKDRKLAARISRAILQESERYNFDPMFLVALIQNESAFKVNQIGGVGEIGLMQIRPETAAWIAKKFDIAYKGPKSLHDPAQNIKIGMAFLSMLRKQFNKESQLYVSAYNMGARKVRLLADEETTPTVYVNAIMRRYAALYEGLKKKGGIEARTKEAFLKLRKATGARKVAGDEAPVGDDEYLGSDSLKETADAPAADSVLDSASASRASSEGNDLS